MAGTDRKHGSAARFVADAALRKTGSIARKQLDRRLAGLGLTANDVARLAAGKQGFGTRIAAAALMRLATRSVPGALAVGGGIVAKALLDRKRQRKGDGSPG